LIEANSISAAQVLFSIKGCLTVVSSRVAASGMSSNPRRQTPALLLAGAH
jgi:hypothetical protein